MNVTLNSNMNAAQEWIRTDEAACKSDVKRLGLDGATDYQMSLIVDRSAAGDTRWDGITDEQMRAALEQIGGAS